MERVEAHVRSGGRSTEPGDGGSITILNASREAKGVLEQRVAALDTRYEAIPVQISSHGLLACLEDRSLNEGPFPPVACVELLRKADPNLIRAYSSADNTRLATAIADAGGITPANIVLGHGSGPLLQAHGAALLRSGVTASPLRIARHLVGRRGYPVITTDFTYGKVLEGAQKGRMLLVLLFSHFSGSF